MVLEKAFDRVPKEVISWAMHKLGVEEWLVSTVMSMYTEDAMDRSKWRNNNNNDRLMAFDPGQPG